MRTDSCADPHDNMVLARADRLASQFLEAMKTDVDGSRAEPGCLRFDLLRDKENPNKWVFFEVYQDAEAIAFHREQPHYKAWADFKAEGGVLSQEVLKMEGFDFKA